MKNFILSLDKKRILMMFLCGMLGVILVIAVTNICFWIKLQNLQTEVEAQKKELNRSVAEQVTEIIHDPIYMAGGGNKIETETLINTDTLLTSDQIRELKKAVIAEVEVYVTEDVYLGLKELLLDELNESIHVAVKNITTDTLSDEQQEIIISTIQEKVLEETSESIKKISKELTSNNKLIKALESTVTSFDERMTTLESTLDDSISELEKKDKELETAINQLRLAFVASNVGTSDLSILSVQMATNMNVLSGCENALKNNLTSFPETEKNSYLTAIEAYREQVKIVDDSISAALDKGDSSAGEKLAMTAAELSKSIVDFGNMIEKSKISLSSVKAELQGKIDELDTNMGELEIATKNNTSRITDLQSAKDSLEAADNSLFAISEALKAADQALEQTSTDNLNTALFKITSLVGSIPEGSSVAAQLSQAQTELEKAKISLETAIAEGNAEAIAEAESNAAAALESARNEIETSIESIIGDIPDGKTISSLFEGVDTDIDQVKADLSVANSNLVTAKTELEAAIASGSADAVAEAEQKVTAAKAELNTAIANAQTGLQNNIGTIENQINQLNNAVTEANNKIAEAENNISGLQTDVNSLETEVDAKASQSDLETTTNEINQDLQEAKEDINNALTETTDTINNSIASKADKSDLENVMKAKVSTDESGKTTITMIVEGEQE